MTTKNQLILPAQEGVENRASCSCSRAVTGSVWADHSSWWQVANERRGELIDLEGVRKLTALEKREFDELQELADLIIQWSYERTNLISSPNFKSRNPEATKGDL